MRTLPAAGRLWREGRHAEAEGIVRALLAVSPDEPPLWRALAEMLAAAGRHAEALDAWRRLAELCPRDAEVQRALAQALLTGRAHAEAVEALRRAIALEPDNTRGYNNLGIVQLRTGDTAGAILTLTEAVTRDPTYALAQMNLGMALEAAGDVSGARSRLTRALALDPHLSTARTRLSMLLEDVDADRAGRERELALESEAINLMTVARHDAAIPLLTQLIDSGSDLPFLEGTRFHCHLQCCDWTNYDDTVAALDEEVRTGLPAVLPFSFFVHSNSAALQRRCAEVFTATRYPASRSCAEPVAPSARIKVAYLSFDFFEHATAYLVSALFEVHDRNRFEIIALSYGPDDRSPARARLQRAVDEFIDVGRHTDTEVAALMRRLGVQIAVDLKGHSGGARTGILAQRAAPIQVNFLGYPGTLGAEYVDYLVADPRIIPEAAEVDYSERIIYLPHSYQPNDPHRPRPAASGERRDHGLPPKGFVFGCFNNLYKISPAVFKVWMTLLTEVADSVLWLLGGNELAMENLRRAAAACGVAPGRLLFANHLPLEDHLRRYHWMDLFLDTSPCNAHTTASDALWMGVPLITVTGRTFAGRVATSLLHAVDLAALAMPDLASYGRAALRIATDTEELTRLKRHLEQVRASCPLFDVAGYAGHLESAYRAIWEAHMAGRAPQSIHISASVTRENIGSEGPSA